MEQAELEQIIEKAKVGRDRLLTLSCCNLESLPESIGGLINLNELRLRRNQLTKLPESIGNLTNLTYLDLNSNQLDSLPESIGNLTSLSQLHLIGNRLASLPQSIGRLTKLTELSLPEGTLNTIPESIGDLSNLSSLYLCGNQINSLPQSIGNLTQLMRLDLSDNQLNSLPDTIENLTNLRELHLSKNLLDTFLENIVNMSSLEYLHLDRNNITILPNTHKLINLIYINLNNNPLIDLSALKDLPNLKTVRFLNVDLPRRYWIKFSNWNPAWLLDEDNAEIRRILVEQVGYEKICKELDVDILSNWREYTLVKIDGVEARYNRHARRFIGREPLVLLKMTCPSTGHIHILRVPPEMTSAEAAITWVNHGIHPDKFAVQT